MDLSKIMAVSGKPGLYIMVAKTRNGLVVESLLDGKRMPVFASDRSSSLEDISIFTYEKDVPLKEVLWSIHQKYDGAKGPDPKSSPDELKAAFEEVLPDYDKDRVHVSDIKKIFAWYNILLDKDMISEPEEDEEKEAGRPMGKLQRAKTRREKTREKKEKRITKNQNPN